MTATKKALLLGAGVLLALGALAKPLLLPRYLEWRESARWTPASDFSFAPNQAAYAEQWDDLNAPLSQGGLAPRPWAHFTKTGIRRQSFQMRVTFRAAQPGRPYWLKLIAASPVEYYSLPDASALAERPRSRFAGFFGRLDHGATGTLLSAGQEDLKGRAYQVASQALEKSPGTQTLLLTFEDDRLTLQWGAAKVETLARELFIGQGPDLQFGLAGENSLVSRLQTFTRKDPGNLAAEAEADGYALVGKTHMAEPIYRDLALAQKDPSRRDRYELRQANALFLSAKRDEAGNLLKALIARAPLSFYAGYANVDLAKIRLDQGAPPEEMDRVLPNIYKFQPKHPEAGAARMMHAKVLAQQAGRLPEAHRLALDALQAGDPAVQVLALDFLGNSSTAVDPFKLLEELRPAAAAPGASPILAEALAQRQAQWHFEQNDLSGLAQACLDSLDLALSTRLKVYQLLVDLLEKRKTGPDAEALWAALELERPMGDHLLRDLLAVQGLRLYFTPTLQGSIRPSLIRLAQVLASHVSLPVGEAALSSERRLINPSERPRPSSYGHIQQPSPTYNGDEACLEFKSGNYWGCGLSFEATQAPRNEGGSVDLRGYKYLRAELWAPEGTQTYLSISESGVSDPQSESFSGENGADGEQFLFPVLLGTGIWQELKLPLQDVLPALNWGNLRGNLVLDLQAIKKVDLGIPGSQGNGRTCLKNIRFTVE